MTELLRILQDLGDGSYLAARLLYGHPAGRFPLIVQDGPPLLQIGEVLSARRERIGTEKFSELVYVVGEDVLKTNEIG